MGIEVTSRGTERSSLAAKNYRGGLSASTHPSVKALPVPRAPEPHKEAFRPMSQGQHPPDDLTITHIF